MGDQISLLPEPSPADHAVAPKPGRARRSDPPTSKRAAQHVAFKVGALKHRILVHLVVVGAKGATDFELWQACDPKGRPHSAATRRGTLEDLGLVRRTALTRPTDTPGNEGLVHVITEAGAAVVAHLAERSEAA